MDRDRLGRRRQPHQERGLRPLHPLLPEAWVSRPLRVAMSAADWNRFEHLVQLEATHEATQARAHGATITRLMNAQPPPHPQPAPGPLDWMDWERRKALRLLLPRQS
jgi:hypothetical protein